MLFKYVCWLIPYLVVVHTKSLTLVIDSTKSMQYELEIIKKGVTEFVEDVTTKKNIEEYVLVKFRDPDLGLSITNNKLEFQNYIEELSPEGGEDCPENSLSAIKKGLEKSQDNSLLYVMTDAYAKDTYILNDIKELCKETGSRVSIFLSGTCVHNGTEEMSAEHLSVYKEITKWCSGKLEVTNEMGFKQAFKYEEMERENLLNDFDPKNQVESVEDISQECNEEKATTNDDCSKELFYFGMPFWPVLNGKYDCKPYVVSAQDVSIIQEVIKQAFNEYNKRKKTAKECLPKPKCEPNPEPVSTSGGGRPEPRRPEPRGPIIRPEQPRAEITEPWNNEVQYGADVTITCKVTGVPKPAIKWSDSENRLYKYQTIKGNAQHTYISYIHLKNITNSKSYTCEGTNEVGSSVATIAIEVKQKNRFEVIRTPTDQTVEIYTEGRLECEADVYPEAEITWYLNDTSIYSYNIETNQRNLIIKNMTTNEVGNYTCKISNENESKKFSAFVYISGLEKPTANIDSDEIKVKSGEHFRATCSASGKPAPEVTWSYKSKNDYDFNDIPYGMYHSEGVLYTDKVKLTYQGIYRCNVQNYVGTVYDDITLSIGSPPVIENNQMQTLTVLEKQQVYLECNVQSDLPVKVKWEFLNTDGITITKFNDRHNTDEGHTHSFIALWEDAGTYRCIAENEAGVTEKTIMVDVYVKPYIRPTNNFYKVKTGCNVTLPCIIQNGNPVPNVYWEHKPLRGPAKVLSPGPDNNLTLVDVHKSHEGIYKCTAKNVAGHDTIDIKLIVG